MTAVFVLKADSKSHESLTISATFVTRHNSMSL